MRWRVAVNRITLRHRKDSLQKISMFLAILTPALLLLIFVPLILGFGVAAFFGGRHLADRSGETGAVVAVIARLLLGALTFGMIIAPIIRSSSGQGSNVRRFLLLPVSDGALHLQMILSAATDPWLLAVLPALLFLPAGVAAAGDPGKAGLLLATGALTFGCLALIGAIASSLMALLFKRRKRAEMISLVVIIGLSSIGFLPQLLAEETTDGRHNVEISLSSIDVHSYPLWAQIFPSEIYGRSMSDTGEPLSVATAGKELAAPFGLLVLMTLLYQASSRMFRKILLEPESGSTSGAGAGRADWQLTLPGISPPVAGQAQAWFLAWTRTIRGKMAWIVPPLFLFFVNVLWADALMAELPDWIVLVKGPMLAQAGLLLAFLNMQSMMMNQFAIDGPGLSGTFTHPVTRRQILRGKQIALALILFPSVLLVIGLSILLGRDGSVWTWLAILLNSVAVFLILGTLGALFSILFPRKADLMSIGKASNPHPVASLVGTIATAILLGPGTGMSLATWVGFPAWTPTALLALWVAMTWAGSRVLENMTIDALERRQEMLLSLARGA